MKKSNKNVLKSMNGITLIALVVSIIVLLILAGVSIGMLSGNSGILNKVTDAKFKTEFAKAKEALALANSVAVSDKFINGNNEILANTVAELRKQDWVVEQEKDSGATEQIIILDGEIEIEDNGTVSVEKDSTKILNVDVQSVSSNGQVLPYYMLVSGRYHKILEDEKGNLSLQETETSEKKVKGITDDSVTYALNLEPLNTENATVTLNDGKITIVGNERTTENLAVTIKYVNIENTEDVKISKSFKISITQVLYLLDASNIGDYVDINIPYINMKGTEIEYTNNGWRILKKDFNTRSVTLISTAQPLTFYHPTDNDGASSVSELCKVKTESLAFSGSGLRGYKSNGFSTNDVKSLFNNESVFNEMTIPMKADFSEFSINNDLRNTGQAYFLGESGNGKNPDSISDDGRNDAGKGGTKGVRLVITLKSGVKIRDGEGTNTSPYRLDGIDYSTINTLSSSFFYSSKKGDYVDINVPYTNKQGTEIQYTNNGWRVLNRNYNTRTVTLISTAQPLTFYHPNTDVEASLEELYKVSTDTLSFSGSGLRGYKANGFTTNDVKGLFNNESDPYKS